VAGRLAPAFNVASLVLLSRAGVGLSGGAAPNDGLSKEANPLASTVRDRPDIYYIVLDGYGSSEVLREIFAVDDRPFREGLERRGFYLAADSHANYLRTVHSILSSLSMGYVMPNARKYARAANDYAPLVSALRANAVMDLVRRNGYEVHRIESGYAGTEITQRTHYVASAGSLSEFESTLLNLTPIPTLLASTPIGDQYEAHRRRIAFILDELPRLAIEPSPKFVFAHIVSPHPPFVFDADGGAVENPLPFDFLDGRHFIERRSRAEYIQGYAGQARFIAARILETIDGIRAMSEKPPVIVLQGDHGPGSSFDHERLGATNIRERAFILNAYLLPDSEPREALYPEITPVNTFRLILGHYLGADLPLRPDRSFYCPESAPYEFTEVTDRISQYIARRRALRDVEASLTIPDSS
jgi:hypothetical protein